jgi:protocatechuate 3,4-dioxygenase beta subunit
MSNRSPYSIFRKPPADARRYYDPEDKGHYLALSRRTVVKASAVMAIGAAGMGATRQGFAQGDDATPPTGSDGVCVLTPELTEGPYYLDDMILREDVAEGKAGVPLELTMLTVNAETCEPIANAAVEIWHCDALGFYSGFVENNPGGTGDYEDDGSNADTFCRGLQITGADGLVTFRTVYPGWYGGRAIHIHLKVHVGGEAANGTYKGGHFSHTGQIAFDDAVTDVIAQVEPYASKSTTFTRTLEDGVFRDIEEDDPAWFVDLTPVDEADIASGFTGTMTLGVIPEPA